MRASLEIARLNHATQQMEEAVERVENAVTEAQDHSDPKWDNRCNATPRRLRLRAKKENGHLMERE
jgi:hypothetical protein